MIATLTSSVSDSWYMLGRQARNLIRQPIWITIMIVEPIVWITLFGQLFRRLTELPGFETDNYIQFLAPGIVVMASFFSASWSGWNTLTDLDRGVIERFLATPVSRLSIITSQVFRSGIIGAVKAVLILLIALALGASVTAGIAGWFVLIAVAALIAAVFSGLSHGIALIVRKEETLIAAVTFFALPLTFLSASLIAEELMPEWMQWGAKFNPVNWAVQAAREVMSPSVDWGAVAVWMLLLVAGSVVTCAFATWTFRVYRRTL